MADRDLERQAGKSPEDEHPEMIGDATNPDPSDSSDPRVTPPGEDPPGENALRPRRDSDPT